MKNCYINYFQHDKKLIKEMPLLKMPVNRYKTLHTQLSKIIQSGRILDKTLGN